MTRRGFLAAVALAGVLIAAPGAAASDECIAPVRAPEVSVVIDESPVRYDHSLGGPDMANLAGRGVGHAHGPEPAGLTVGEFAVDLSTTVTLRQLGGSGYCVVPQRVEARIALANTVYIERAYARGTCQFYEVLAHENVHVDINRDSARDAMDRVRRRIEVALAAQPTLVARDRDTAGRVYGDVLGRAIEPAIAAAEAARDERHTDFDAVEGVVDWNVRCPGG